MARRAHVSDADGPVPLELPNQWLWNIVDEFIYQFQHFSQFRSKLLKKVRDMCYTLLCTISWHEFRWFVSHVAIVVDEKFVAINLFLILAQLQFYNLLVVIDIVHAES